MDEDLSEKFSNKTKETITISLQEYDKIIDNYENLYNALVRLSNEDVEITQRLYLQFRNNVWKLNEELKTKIARVIQEYHDKAKEAYEPLTEHHQKNIDKYQELVKAASNTLIDLIEKKESKEK